MQDPDKKYVIAVCGGSCSGKTTIASSLASELNSMSVQSPANRSSDASTSSLKRIRSGSSSDLMRTMSGQKSIHLDPADAAHHANVNAISGDDFFLFDQYMTDSCPSVEINGRVWKDWESTGSLNWQEFVNAITLAKNDPDSPKYIVVEGFLALATPESRALFDAAIEIRMTKEECWKRRKKRAAEMSHLPPGFSNGDEKRNYEVLATYVKSDADHQSFRDAAAPYEADDGDLAWLRMYFEDVIWPAALQQDEELQKVKSHLPVLTVDAADPPGKDEWKEARFPECVTFIFEKLKPSS